MITLVALLALLQAEVIDFSCDNLREALKVFEGRKLTPQEAATKAKLEEWLKANGCWWRV